MRKERYAAELYSPLFELALLPITVLLLDPKKRASAVATVLICIVVDQRVVVGRG